MHLRTGRVDLDVSGDADMRNNWVCGRSLFAQEVPLVIEGATGTGKEVFAKALHNSSHWADKPFIPINFAALGAVPGEYESGDPRIAAATSWMAEFRKAGGGTLFLDHISDLPMAFQACLVRLIDDPELVASGRERPCRSGAHVITSTCRNIQRMIKEGQFREDLYYRLNGHTLNFPLLRDREDKGDLIRIVLQQESSNQRAVKLTDRAFLRLMEYPWPGNIRQLRVVLRTAIALCQDGVIHETDLPEETRDVGFNDSFAEVDMAPGLPALHARPREPISPLKRGTHCVAMRPQPIEMERYRDREGARPEPKYCVPEDAKVWNRFTVAAPIAHFRLTPGWLFSVCMRLRRSRPSSTRPRDA